MLRDRRFAKLALALIAAAVLAVAISGCAYFKSGSLAGSQPGDVGSVRVHFVLCTTGKEICSENEDTETLQYLVGIAVPPGSTPPASFTAVPLKGGSAIVFTRSEEVASEMAAASVTLQKLLAGAGTQKEKEEAQQLKALLGDTWPPSGMQGEGYISEPVTETEGANLEWSVDADFGVPAATDSPFVGPFGAAIAFGFREVEKLPGNRSVHCVRFEESVKSEEGDAFCGGTVQTVQVGTSDLKILAPKKKAKVFAGESTEVPFKLKFASTAGAPPSFKLRATTTQKRVKAKLASKKFKPGKVNGKTHLAPTKTSKVKVKVPKGVKPGTYKLTLTAKTAQGGIATGVAKFRVKKPKP